MKEKQKPAIGLPTVERRQTVAGQAAAAKANREREVRLRIIQALRRLEIPINQWPDFVRMFETDPHELTRYSQSMTPPSFQAPEFDRLNQSSQDWVKVADRAWELHRNNFLQTCESWVRQGVDEEIVDVKRIRGSGRGHNRGDNTPVDQRYEWVARYLAKTPLKEIAGADANASTVGRVARAILRSADWPLQ